MEIDGCAALVTGGGGMLGATTVERLASLGARVVVADLAEGRAAELRRRYPEQVTFVATDVTDESQVEDAVAVARGLGELRAAVCCAGAGIIRRTLARDGTRHDIAGFRAMLEINLVGSFTVLVHAAAAMSSLPEVADGERGAIILTASLAGLEGSAGQIAYGSSKAGVAGMTLPAARDLAPVGIRVVTIAPGAMVDDPAAVSGDERLEQLRRAVPHPRRFGTSADYALLVTQVLENSYLNGSVIRLDGAARLGLKY